MSRGKEASKKACLEGAKLHCRCSDECCLHREPDVSNESENVVRVAGKGVRRQEISVGLYIAI